METFYRFNDFPPEIRALIFLFATPPRIVLLKAELQQEPQTTWDRIRCFLGLQQIRVKRINGWYFHSHITIPPLLHTCHESRVALISQGYQLAFGSSSAEPRTWFNYHRDVLAPCSSLEFDDRFRDPWRLAKLEQCDMKRVRKLVWDYSPLLLYLLYSLHTPMSNVVEWENLENYENLEELYVLERGWESVVMNRIRRGHFNDFPTKRHRYDTKLLLKCIDAQPFSVLYPLKPVPGLADLDPSDIRRGALEFRNSRVSRDKVDPDWKPPRVTAVHLVDEWGEIEMQEITPAELGQLIAWNRSIMPRVSY